MPLDPVLVAETRGWLVKATRDLRIAEHALSARPPLLDALVFHCQQAAEKALKGLLTFHDRPFRKTHSLEELGEACLAIDESLREAIDCAVPLTEYAWKYRYPGEAEEPTQEEAQQALADARQLLVAILAKIPAEARQ